MNPASAEPTSDAASSAALAAPSSPIHLLYSHALQSVLSWLSLPELSAAVVVSKSWNAAERNMASLQWSFRSVLSIRRSPLLDECPTGLARHISSLGMNSFRLELNAPMLVKLGVSLVNLSELRCEINEGELPPDPATLPLPRTLAVLRIKASCQTVSKVNDLIVACSRVPSLTDLTFKTFRREIDFSPLSAARMPWLRRFAAPWIFPDKRQQPMYSPAQIDQFRAMSQLEYLSLSPISGASAHLLLALPNTLATLQTADIFWPLTDETASLLPRLPNLTMLLQDYDLRLSSVSFLRSLPVLQSCTLHCGKITAPVEDLVASLAQCGRLTYLCLMECPLRCADLSVVLAALPMLECLSLSNAALESLACFSTASVTRAAARSLRTLQLYNCSHPRLAVAELQHLLALQSLTDLTLNNVCASAASAEDLSPFVPPSRVMRRLSDFNYSWQNA